MPKPSEFVSRIYIKVGGTEVPRTTMQKLAEVVVDQHTHLPDYFTIRLYDEEKELLDNGPFDLTKEVEIESALEDGTKVKLIKGEITSLEPIFKDGMNSELLVRGYDKSHRMFRELKSKAYLNKKDSDLASEIAGEAGLQAEVETTSTVYDHIYQHNQSDLSFLMQRAWRIGFECFVSEGKLYFRKPPTNGSSSSLTWGDDLLSFTPRMVLAEQVDEVQVKGWDIDKQEAIIGRATSGSLYPEVEETKDGATWAQTFGTGKTVIVNQPVVSQAEADALAAARLDEISGAFLEAEGTAFRRPDIKAGQMVEIEALGDRFSGTFLVTNATHILASEGLKTFFSAWGTRTGLLNEKINGHKPEQRWYGAVPAIVTNTDDPKDWGRVKVKFPWMADDAESDWARVTGIGAGKEAGFYVMPEVGDEVLVLFAHGDFSQPHVIGSLWNGQNAIPSEVEGVASGEKPLVRTWHSQKGHRITIYDNADNKVEILTEAGHHITLDDADRKISIESSGGLTLTLDDSSGKITLESNNQIELKATGNLKIEAGGNLDMEARGILSIKGAMVTLN